MPTKILDVVQKPEEKKKKTEEEVKKEYREYMKNYMKTYMKKKITCECGRTITLSSKPYHIKTEGHKMGVQLEAIKKLIKS